MLKIEELEYNLLNEDEPFDPAKWLNSQGVETTQQTLNLSKKRNFKDLCRIVKNDLDKKIEDSNDKEQEEWLSRQHNAIIGNQASMQYFVNQIESVLRDRNISSSDYPYYYSSLAEAIFHEVWGRSILQKWYHYPDSEAAVITGTELWIDRDGDFVKQAEPFENEEKVREIIRAFTMRDENAILNAQNPELELESEDGSRITLIVKPRGKENYIIFRRFIVKNFSLEKQASYGTITDEDIPIFRALARVMPNTVIAGRVRSAKSTFMKTLIGERRSDYVIGCLEKHFELALKRHFLNRLIFEIQSAEGDLHKVMPRMLRMEHDYLVIGECRSLEWESAIQACERGERGMITTYHLTDRHAIVPQITRHLLDEYPSRRFENEVERVARNVDIVITMSTSRDRRRKQVVGVTEVIWDDKERIYKSQDLIVFDKLEKVYKYSSNISSRLYRLMVEEDEEQAKILLDSLRKREKFSPLNKELLEHV